MTPTISAPPAAGPTRTPHRWTGVAFGLLVGMLVVCHGCHVGDHDDELSVNGREVRKNSVNGAATVRGRVEDLAPRPAP